MAPGAMNRAVLTSMANTIERRILRFMNLSQNPSQGRVGGQPAVGMKMLDCVSYCFRTVLLCFESLVEQLLRNAIGEKNQGITASSVDQ